MSSSSYADVTSGRTTQGSGSNAVVASSPPASSTSTTSSLVVHPQPPSNDRIPASQQQSTRPSTSNSNKSGLKATIGTVYDLPFREPPLYVQIRLTNNHSTSRSIKSGPPTSRHKDRNSFKFDNHQELFLPCPLSTLYEDTVVIEVCYEQMATHHHKLKATYQLNQLNIHEPTLLLLTLEGGGEGAASSNDSSSMAVPPTIRLHLTLVGPYRAEVSTLLGLLGVWFRFIETAEASSQTALAKLPQLPIRIDPKWLLLPAVPVGAVVVVSAPIVLGILTIGLPVFLPILVFAGLGLCAVGCAILATWSSTTQGRRQIAGALGPLWNNLVKTAPVQQLVYATGPRPSPVTVARTVTPISMNQKLIWSLAIDAIGSCSYLIPFAGEAFDVGWAPMQTVLIMAMYDTVSPNLKYLSMFEELLPFTDVIPSATMGWLTEFGMPLIQEKLLGGSGSSTSASAASSLNKQRPVMIAAVPERTGVAE